MDCRRISAHYIGECILANAGYEHLLAQLADEVLVPGTLAVVLSAKQRQLIPSARVVLTQLRHNGFRIDEIYYSLSLPAAGVEPSPKGCGSVRDVPGTPQQVRVRRGSCGGVPGSRLPFSREKVAPTPARRKTASPARIPVRRAGDVAHTLQKF